MQISIYTAPWVGCWCVVLQHWYFPDLSAGQREWLGELSQSTFLQRRIMTLVITVVSVQLQKPERTAKSPPQVVSKHLKNDWQMLEGWKNDEQLG